MANSMRRLNEVAFELQEELDRAARRHKWERAEFRGWSTGRFLVYVDGGSPLCFGACHRKTLERRRFETIGELEEMLDRPT